MRRISLCLFIALVVIVPVGCSDDPTFVSTPRLHGRVLYASDATPAESAVVYLGRPLDELQRFWQYADSAMTDGEGQYEFVNVAPGTYRTYAAVIGNKAPSRFSHVSPPSGPIDAVGGIPALFDDLLLQPVVTGGSVTGEVRMAGIDTLVANAYVGLYRLEGVQFVLADTTSTTAHGEYMFTEVATGHYRVFSWLFIPGKGPFALFNAESADFFCRGMGMMRIDPLVLIENELVRKPAIYIYPERAGRFQVQLDLQDGMQIVSSIPEYGNGWDVFVEESGRMDDRYDYLFYEVSLPALPQLENGWCLSQTTLARDLNDLLSRLGLNADERQDFLAYWLEVLYESPHYRVYPVVMPDLDQWVELSVTPRPDSVLRFWLFFEGCDRCGSLPPFAAPEFPRLGTTVVEWGGVLLPAVVNKYGINRFGIR
jgi:hypothetical protein